MIARQSRKTVPGVTVLSNLARNSQKAIECSRWTGHLTALAIRHQDETVDLHERSLDVVRSSGGEGSSGGGHQPSCRTRPFTQATRGSSMSWRVSEETRVQESQQIKRTLVERGSRPLTMKPRYQWREMGPTMLELGGEEQRWIAPPDVGFGSVHKICSN